MSGQGRLKGKVAIVTGAGTGLGRATTELFVDEGADVVVVGRRARKLEEVADELAGRPGRIAVVAADVAREEAAARACQEAVQQFAGSMSWSTMPGFTRIRSSCTRRRSRSTSDSSLVIRCR